jgi:hypothetical protein
MRVRAGRLSGQKSLCAPYPFARQFLDVIRFGSQIGCHHPEAFGQVLIFTILRQTSTHAGLSPQLYEDHSRTPTPINGNSEDSALCMP